MENNYYCYFIISHSNNKTYIGITNNLQKRIIKHNHSKGAKSTRMSSKWSYHTIVGKFKNKGDAMSFEWYWKHQTTKNNKWIGTKAGIDSKMRRLLELFLDERWKYVGIVKKL